MSSKSRRTTLGAIQNRRTSMAPSFTNNAEKAKSKNRTRMSMAPRISSSETSSNNSKPTTPGRRRSFGGDGILNNNISHSTGKSNSRRMSVIPPPNTAKKDTRPISDKKYINSCIRKLHNYLINNDYEYPVKLKDLQLPSSKDFHRFVTFLLRKIDPTFPQDESRKIEEIALAFKSVGYPFNISKTALTAAGAPHTWPTLLLALTWLIELLESNKDEEFFTALNDDNDGIDIYDFEDEKNDTENFNGDGGALKLTTGTPGELLQNIEQLEMRTEKAFVKYVESSYEHFLAGDDKKSEMLEEGLLSYMEKDNMVIEEEIERGTEECADIVEATNEVEKEMEDLPQRQERLEVLATDIEKFHELVRQLNEHKSAITQKVQQRTKSLEQIDQQLKQKEDLVSHYKTIVETQELSMEDVQKIEKEQGRIQTNIDQGASVKKDYDEAALQSYADLKKTFAKLNVLAHNTYNKQIDEAMDLIEDEKFQQFKLNPQIDYANEKDRRKILDGADLQGEILPSLRNKIDNNAVETLTIKRKTQDARHHIENSHAALVEKRSSIETCEVQKQRLKARLSKDKEEVEAALALRMKEIERVEEKINVHRDPVALEESISKCQRQCTELEALRQKHQDENLARKQAVIREINEVIRVGASHRSYQEKIVGEVIEYLRPSTEKTKLELSERDEQILNIDET